MRIKGTNTGVNYPVVNGVISSKWQQLQDALAAMLGITITVVGVDGHLHSVHNLRPPFDDLIKNREFRNCYRDFFRRLPGYYSSARVDRILIDPIGLPMGVFSTGEGCFLLLGGCLDRKDPERLQDLKKRLHGFGIDYNHEQLFKMELMSRDELREKVINVEMLYLHMSRSINESNELDRQMLLLSSVEEVNKLMVATLNPECFHLPSVLDLMACSLVILSDAKGALAFTHRDPGHSEAVFRGECSGLMEALRDRWEKISGAQENPIDIFPGIASNLVNDDKGTVRPIEMNIFKGAQSSAFLAVLDPQIENMQPILSALCRQVAIALEISSLYHVLHRQFGMLLNSIKHGIVVTDQDTNAALVNKSARNILKSVSVNLSPGKPLSGCGMCRRMEEAVERVVRTGCSITQKRSTIGDGENTVHLRWDAIPLAGEDGALAGSILIIDDITEPVNLFREIQDWERLATAGEVAAGLAHEIRNPLATAMAAIQLFELSEDRAKRRELMGKLGSELERMNCILTSFLSLSKPALKETQEQVDIAAVLGDMEYLIRSEAHFNEIELVINQKRGVLSPVIGSATDVKQVFLNIARNAVEAMSRGGRLVISVSREDGWIKVSFKDNGEGISPENLENITRPFFTTKLGGTGLGLSISSSIVKMMGGRISIISQLDKGTTVEIFLPVYRDSLE